ncbi:MAG: xanthine dehydrogenase family protein subunit M [Phenylobacterium sp.]
MKPAPFEFALARDVDHAAALLAGGSAKVLAGGQSLMPLLNFRMLRPELLVDINRIPGLERIEATAHGLRIGALARHCAVAASPLVAERAPAVVEALEQVAHFTVRNRGTFVGSVCHADPAAEMPMMALLYDGVVEAKSARGVRKIAARDFFVGPLMTVLEPDEMATGVELSPPAGRHGFAFEEYARRRGDFALAAVGVLVTAGAGEVRIGLCGVGDTPLRAAEAERLLTGSSFDADAVAKAVAAIRAQVEPMSDLHASADYRRHLVGVLAERALARAWGRA